MVAFRATIAGTIPIFVGDFRHNVPFRGDICRNDHLVRLYLAECPSENHSLNGFAANLKKLRAVQAASVPAMIGINALLRRYSPDTLPGPACGSGRSAEGEGRARKKPLERLRKDH